MEMKGDHMGLIENQNLCRSLRPHIFMADRSCAGLYVIVTLTHVIYTYRCLERPKSQHACCDGPKKKANLIYFSLEKLMREISNTFSN